MADGVLSTFSRAKIAQLIVDGILGLLSAARSPD